MYALLKTKFENYFIDDEVWKVWSEKSKRHIGAMHPKGYELVTIHQDGKTITYRVHRLIYETLVGKISEGMEIDHIDTNPRNNSIENLRVCTPKENRNNPLTLQHYSKMHSGKLGKEHPASKPILQLDKNTDEVIKEWACAMDVQREMGINHSNISRCCNGKLKSSGGYIWKYKSEE